MSLAYLRTYLSLALCMGLGLTACGEDEGLQAEPSDAGASNVEADSSLPDTGAELGFPCPDTPPVVGEPCHPGGTLCGYDPASLDGLYTTSAHPTCRDLFECEGGSWVERDRDTSCAAQADPSCPGVIPTEGSSCSQTELACRYGAAVCYCMSCTPQDPGGSQTEPTWQCSQPEDPLCPQLAPAEGEACDLPKEHTCFGYEKCFVCGPWGSVTLPQCVDGTWDTINHGDCMP